MIRMVPGYREYDASSIPHAEENLARQYAEILSQAVERVRATLPNLGLDQRTEAEVTDQCDLLKADIAAYRNAILPHADAETPGYGGTPVETLRRSANTRLERIEEHLRTLRSRHKTGPSSAA